MQKEIEQNIQALSGWADTVIDFLLTDGFQSLGALIVLVIALRFHGPSMQYFQLRYRLDEAVLAALREAGFTLMKVGSLAVTVPPHAGDEPGPEEA